MDDPPLPTVRLGRTGLSVSAAGLGCGGHSRLGQSSGASFDESVAVVQRAVDLGVTFVDTARAYGTEEIVGVALAGRRDEVVLSSKCQVVDRSGTRLTPDQLRESVEQSLRRLDTDRIDVFHLHGVRSQHYGYTRDQLVPTLLDLRAEGEERFIAISEAFAADPGHEMLQHAVVDDCWDVMMVGFNLLNPSARDRVLLATRAADVGVLVMFAVRRALAEPKVARKVVKDLVQRGEVDRRAVSRRDPLGFLIHEGGAATIVEAAYRFARHEPGVDVVLTGTGNVGHLAQNLRSLSLPPLPESDLDRLRTMFGQVDSVSGN